MASVGHSAQDLGLDISDRNEHDGVVGLRNLIESRSVGAVSVRGSRLKDVEAHVEHPYQYSARASEIADSISSKNCGRPSG